MEQFLGFDPQFMPQRVETQRNRGQNGEENFFNAELV